MQQKLRGEMESVKIPKWLLLQRDTILQNILEASPDSIGIFSQNMVYQACNNEHGGAGYLWSVGFNWVSACKMWCLIACTRLSDTDQQVLHQGKSLRYTW